MLSSISPVGERARNQRWWLTASAYLLGSAMGGILTDAVVGIGGLLALSWIGPPLRLALLATGCIGGLIADRTDRVPSLHRQVDERWLTRYRGWVYGLGFGTQLGTGVVTIVPSSIVWALWLGVALLADVRGGAVAGLTFGTLRGLPLVAAGTIRTVSALRRRLAQIDRARPAVGRTVSVAQMAVAAVALAAAVTI